MQYYIEETITSSPVDCILNLPKDLILEKIVNDILNPNRLVFMIVPNGSFDYKFNMDRPRYN